MSYIENPKTKGSGILCAIPQDPEALPCPRQCSDCFFQGGRSYLEPLADRLPNLPPSEMVRDLVVRVNDGLDSGIKTPEVIRKTKHYPNKFYNTSFWYGLHGYLAPVVLTINPGEKTDEEFHRVDKIPENLMFVRFRANMWNQNLLDKAIHYYCIDRRTPLVITYMAYYSDSEVIKNIEENYSKYYTYKKRTLNSYWCTNQRAWWCIIGDHQYNPLVSTCGRDADHHLCKDCGVCLREYWKTKDRLVRDGLWR